MRNSKAVFSEIISGIRLNEGLEEKKAIASSLMDFLFGLSPSDIFRDAPVIWTPAVTEHVRVLLDRVNTGEPVQYITGVAYFFGRRFAVDEAVLIPRPETEELVEQILAFAGSWKNGQLHIADIGTGSGCIPVTLGLETEARLSATDISAKALGVATKNALEHNVQISFYKNDILGESLPFEAVDVLVSNPPYIIKSEALLMRDNVTKFEPHLALFVPDEDPLLFYTRIASEGRRLLTSGGMIIFEINERFGNEIRSLLTNIGFRGSEIVTDLSGKERIVKAFQP